MQTDFHNTALSPSIKFLGIIIQPSYLSFTSPSCMLTGKIHSCKHKKVLVDLDWFHCTLKHKCIAADLGAMRLNT